MEVHVKKGDQTNPLITERRMRAMTTTMTALAVGGAWLVIAGSAEAFTAPASGTFAYDIYDIGVNDILKGPIGFVGGAGAMVLAGVMAIRQMLVPAVATVLGGAFLLKADSVVASLGCMVS